MDKYCYLFIESHFSRFGGNSGEYKSCTEAGNLSWRGAHAGFGRSGIWKDICDNKKDSSSCNRARGKAGEHTSHYVYQEFSRRDGAKI